MSTDRNEFRPRGRAPTIRTARGAATDDDRGDVRGRLARLHTINTSRTFSTPRPRLKPRGLPPALEPHGVFTATNPLDAARYGHQVLGTHRVRVSAGRLDAFGASFHAALIRDVTLGYLDYATAVTIDVERLSDDYLVLMPTVGTAVVRAGDRVVETSPVLAATPQPGTAVRIEGSAEAAFLIVRIDRIAFEIHLSRLLGRTLDRPAVFDLGFDLTTPHASRWNFAVQMLHAELLDRSSLLHDGVGVGQVEEFLMSSLLYSQPSSHRSALVGGRRSQRPTVLAAREFVERHLAEPLTVHEIADAVGVSLRTLQSQFREDLDQTATEYVRNRRLERVRADLADASPGAGITVTEIASRWGFGHMGRFSVTYRARFGESPSHTLRS